MPGAQITAWDRARVRLAAGAAGHALDALPLVELAEQHFLLRRDVLETQVIDTVGQAALDSDQARPRTILVGRLYGGEKRTSDLPGHHRPDRPDRPDRPVCGRTTHRGLTCMSCALALAG